MSVIYLIRHGQASFGDGDYDRLSDLGHRQSRFLGDSLGARLPVVDRIVTGSMRRHRETADGYLGQMKNSTPVVVTPAFDEYDHHDVILKYEPRYSESATVAADVSSAPDPVRAFQEFFSRATARWAGGEHDDDYREPWPRFCERVLAGFGDMVKDLGRSETALIFTSGGPIAVILSTVLGVAVGRAFELQWRLVNAGISKIVIGRNGPAVGSVNEHAHLEIHGREFVTYR